VTARTGGAGQQCAHLFTALGRVDPETPVPHCPGWSAAHLAAHVHAAFTWAAGLLHSGTAEFRPPHEFLREVPEDAMDPGAPWPLYVDGLTRAHRGTPLGERIAGRHTVDPLAESADALTDVLLTGGPDRPVWTPVGEPSSRFWAAWGALESGIHRLDAEAMLGVTPELDREVAGQLVGLTLEVTAGPSATSFFAPQFARLRKSGERILVRAVGSTEGPGEWLIHLAPSGPVLLEPGAGRPDVTVEAPGELLLPLLKRRVPLSAPGVRVTGDADVMVHWLEHVVS
jgi:hypothetical protein